MSAVSFYTGEVVHRRLSGPRHELKYRLAYVLADLDRMNEPNRLRFFSFGRKGLMSLEARDHGDGEGGDLAAWVRDYVRREGVAEPCARIELLTLPRMFGYVFNPISVYFIYGNDGGLLRLLYEVNNTFGGRRFYLAKPDLEDPRLRHECAKTLYVSPFFDVEGGYRFSVAPPGETVRLGIDYLDGAGAPAMTAYLAARRETATDWRCLMILLRFPLMTFGVIAAIHWEALKLFLKGAKFRPAPAAETPVSAGETIGNSKCEAA